MSKRSSFDKLKRYRNGELWQVVTRSDDLPFELSFRSLESRPLKRPELWHYTTVAGLQGILTTNRLWASAAYYLNDSSEVEYGCNVVLRVIEYWQARNKGQDSFLVEVLNALRAVFEAPVSQLKRSSTIHVACFCENDNLLSQWRAYGQVGGYALAFEVDRDCTAMQVKVDGQHWDTRLCRVIYSEVEQRERVHSVLLRIFEPLAERNLAPNLKGSDACEHPIFGDLVAFIEEALLDELVTFKNPAFEEEMEWRVVARYSLRRFRENVSQEKPASILFRHFRGAIVPYIELHPALKQLPIKAIRYGPSLDRKRVEIPLKMMLSVTGFRNVTVDGSELPVIL